MNFRKVFEQEDDSFQMAPLIDIVFLLLTFFIVTGALAAEERETLVELPKTTSAVTRRQEKVDVVVNITRDGQIWLHNRPQSVKDLLFVIAELAKSDRTVPVSVIIRADGKALHEDVLKVIDACAAAKVRNISFVSVNAEPHAIK